MRDKNQICLTIGHIGAFIAKELHGFTLMLVSLLSFCIRAMS